MATITQLLGSFASQIELVLANVHYEDIPINVSVGLHWPAIRVLQQNVKMSPPGAVIAVFDRKNAKDTTRWMPSTSDPIYDPSTLVSSPAKQFIPPQGTGYLTVTGPASTGDAVSFVVINNQFPQIGSDESILSPMRSTVYSPPSTASDLDTATALMMQITTDPGGLGNWVTVGLSGSVLSITNTTNSVITVKSNTGGTGTSVTELARRMRDLQIACWAANPEILDAITDPIEVMIAQIETFRGQSGEYTAGLILPDGTGARVTAINDFLIDDATLSDTYRRDFIIGADYAVTTQDTLYAVLVAREDLKNTEDC